MSEHTLEPWGYSGYCEVDMAYYIGTLGPLGCTGIGIDDTHSMKEVIADVWANDDHDKETLANVRLIAASPDLLKACKALMNSQTEGEWSKAVDMGTAAVKKAENQSA